MHEAQQLQDHLESMRAAPLPLEPDEAVQQAIALRHKHYTYRSIAKVMADYHGVWYSHYWWRHQCSLNGAPVFYPDRAARLGR